MKTKPCRQYSQRPRFFAYILLLTILGSSLPIQANNLIYEGGKAKLQTTPGWASAREYSLFPGKTNAPLSGNNNILINVSPGRSNIELQSVLGGLSQTETVSQNQVTLKNGAVYHLFGGLSESGTVTGNNLIISSGILTGNAYAGSSARGSVTANSVTLFGGSMEGPIYGGHSVSGSATGNAVIVRGGIANSDIYGGYSVNGSAKGNTVTVSAGEINYAIYGGASYTGAVADNNIIIEGGTVTHDVYGGISVDSTSTSNTITLLGKPDMSAASLYGHSNAHNNTSWQTDNNTLTIQRFIGSVKKIRHFQNYHFHLPTTLGPGDTVLTVTDSEPTDISNATIQIVMGYVSPLKTGDAITLIHNPGGLKGAPVNATVKAAMGNTSQTYEFKLETTPNALTATVQAIDTEIGTEE